MILFKDCSHISQRNTMPTPQKTMGVLRGSKPLSWGIGLSLDLPMGMLGFVAGVVEIHCNMKSQEMFWIGYFAFLHIYYFWRVGSMNMVSRVITSRKWSKKMRYCPGGAWHILASFEGGYIQFHVRLSFEISMKNDRGARSKYGA